MKRFLENHFSISCHGFRVFLRPKNSVENVSFDEIRSQCRLLVLGRQYGDLATFLVATVLKATWFTSTTAREKGDGERGTHNL